MALIVLVDKEALREIDRRGGPCFGSSHPLAIHISNVQSIAIFAALSSPGSFLSVLFITNVSILSPLGPTRPVPQVLFITNVWILSLLGLRALSLAQSLPILHLRW